MIRALNAIVATLAVPLLIILACSVGFIVLCGVGYLLGGLVFYGFTGC